MKRQLAVLIAAALLAGCAIVREIPAPSPSAGIEKYDDNECIARNARYCIAGFWVRFKWTVDILKERYAPHLHTNHDS